MEKEQAFLEDLHIDVCSIDTSATKDNDVPLNYFGDMSSHTNSPCSSDILMNVMLLMRLLLGVY